jgi:sodium/proline symporter
MPTATLVTFITYFVLLLGIGLYFYRRSVSIEDYLLGGRRMGAWVTALSAQASDMSGWLLMALPGAIYLAGIGNIWIAIGLFIGTVLNWVVISGRLRIYTQKTNSITLPCFFEERFADPTGLLRIVSAIIILIFFTIYASAHLQATGTLLESTFKVRYEIAVLIGAVIVIVYTSLGGFLAVCWTDFFQGALMVAALIIVPTVAYVDVGGMGTISEAMTGIQKSLIPQGGTFPFLMIISAMAWGLGYFGQPHILARFMSIKSVGKLAESMSIAIVWVFFSLGGAVIIGLVGIGMFDNLAVEQGEHEKVFIYMIDKVMHPWLAGVMLAAILSAIMSTIDSQLLVASSALTEDFYQKAIKKNASEREVVFVGRICVIIISVIALLLALPRGETILRIVAYAWGGFGAAFGPLVLFALFSRKTSWQSALAGMITGTVVLVVWKQIGLGSVMYEIVPGFVANCATILAVNRLTGQIDQKVLTQFDEVVEAIAANN